MEDEELQDDLLARQERLARASKRWFDAELIPTIKDSRNRYNMVLADETTRTNLGLSALPSTKSTAAVDKFVESSIQLYTEPDAITFTAKSTQDPQIDQYSRWLTEIFLYRSKHTFPFFVWHQASLTACGTDGLECAMARWVKEEYDEEYTTYTATNPTTGQIQPVSEEIYKKYSKEMPEIFSKEKGKRKYTVLDTFWIDQLEPGVDVLWDVSVPLLNIQMGQFCLVKLRKTVDEIMSMATQGLIDEIDRDKVESYQKPGSSLTTIYDVTGTDRQRNIDMEDKNRVELWVFFEKINCRWNVNFSIEGRVKLSEQKLVDDVWFNGRRTNLLPVAVGTTKLKLWKQAGRSIPETIAPLEDQHIDHINNVNDAAKQAIQGKWRRSPGSDVNINDLLNRRVVDAEQGDIEQLTVDYGILTAMRVDDAVTAGINELVPQGLVSGGRNVVGKGQERTLGALQLGRMEGDEKQGVAIKTRNQTFLEPLLRIIAELIFAWETNQDVLRKTAMSAGIQPPMVQGPDGQPLIDHTKLDFGVDIDINAGLGSVPKAQKAQALGQLVDVAKTLNEPLDTASVMRSFKVLAGFSADQFTPPPVKPSTPPPPKGEIKLSVTATWQELAMADPTIGQYLLEELRRGHVDVTMKAENTENPNLALAMQNGGGMFTPDRTGQVVNATGPEAMAMSQGGMQNARPN